jgi:hypothetical protein
MIGPVSTRAGLQWAHLQGKFRVYGRPSGSFFLWIVGSANFQMRRQPGTNRFLIG